MTEEQVLDFIDGATWKFAKSMAKIPHWYCLRENAFDIEEFEAFVQHIRDHGYPENFYKRVFIYLNVGEYKYWTMGDTLANTLVINRTYIENRYASRNNHGSR